MPKLERLTCLAYDGTPKNVRMATNLNAIVTGPIVSRRVFLISAPEILPLPYQVVNGVAYGTDGVEFTGTASSGWVEPTYQVGVV